MSHRVSITPTGQRSVDALRGILVCFPDQGSVVVLFVGEHLRDSPEFDVYRNLYRALGLEEPSAERTKPPCCGEAARRL